MEAFVIAIIMPTFMSFTSALNQTYGKVVSVSQESATLNTVEEVYAKQVHTDSI